MCDLPPKSERIVEEGVWGTVEYAIRQSRKMEAKEWLEAQSTKVQASFAHLFRVISNGQRIHNKTQFRLLRGEIWEFKRSGHRILAFRNNNTWYLTHYHKKGGPRKCPKKTMERAEEIRKEHLALTNRESDG